MTTRKSSLDVSKLPTYAFGAKNPLWWGNLAFMIIEGLSFVFSIATYLYLYNQNQNWPLGPQPKLMWSSIGVGLLLLSEVPNVWIKRAAVKHDLKRVRIGLVIMSIIGLFAIAIRCFEFGALEIRWDENAYGSIVWFLLGLHSTHLLTDYVETLVMTFCIFKGPVDMRRFPEIEDNQDYWHFVVAFWVVVYVVVYWIPRWFEAPL